uniref:Reverse transcriptase domain-containing protein n=2 Tax=Nicotiana TaxID=4085 RepID=A0A1S4CT67_TOBAC|nr:PREDICTED: uncharacterized protein LOC104229636 [Nicotiana sylvestris]XP_016504305.1 PREDICTED: uncharacterized protein LOC107822288 [Nicotiana tabacum]
MDAILIANESVNARIKSKELGIMCKLDIEKAYDHLNWKFLLGILLKMGFDERWISRIKFCINTVKFSILVNGSPVGSFSSQRGLRQRDAISPFLFILAMEGLHNLFKTAKANNRIRGFRVNSRESTKLEITHLQYADDTLVFCDASREQLLFLRMVFILFEAISGLHINWNKSFIYPVNEVMEMHSLARILGGKIGALPIHWECHLEQKANQKEYGME